MFVPLSSPRNAHNRSGALLLTPHKPKWRTKALSLLWNLEPALRGAGPRFRARPRTGVEAGRGALRLLLDSLRDFMERSLACNVPTEAWAPKVGGAQGIANLSWVGEACATVVVSSP